MTYQGTPVPSGELVITPDRQRGNKGPQAFAQIRDGRYEIRSEKGAVTGPVRIVISGADGRDRDDNLGRPYGNWLFRNHTVTADFGPGGKEMDFDVP